MNVISTFPERKRGRKKKWLHLQHRILELAVDPKLSYTDIENITGVPRTTVRDYVKEAEKEKPPAQTEGHSTTPEGAAVSQDSIPLSA